MNSVSQNPPQSGRHTKESLIASLLIGLICSSLAGFILGRKSFELDNHDKKCRNSVALDKLIVDVFNEASTIHNKEDRANFILRACPMSYTLFNKHMLTCEKTDHTICKTVDMASLRSLVQAN